MLRTIAVVVAFLCPSAQDSKWAVVESPTKESLRGVWFADEAGVTAVGSNGAVISSADGGRTWTLKDAGTKATLRGVHFLDAKRGWACGDGDPDAPRVSDGHVVITGNKAATCGTILMTGDGGKTWTSEWVQTNFELRSIWMATAEAGQICNHGGEDHADGDRILTSDGGKTWSQTRVFRGLNDCCWVSPKEGWAVGSGVQVMFMGGKGAKSALETHKTARIVHTTDGGTTWEPVEGPDIGKRKQLRSVWFVDKDLGCAVGDSGAILATTDGGKTWEARASGVEKNLLAVCFRDKKAGWAVGAAGTIVATRDGGRTWSKQEAPAKGALYGLHVNAKGVVIATGEGGTILRCEDR